MSKYLEVDYLGLDPENWRAANMGEICNKCKSPGYITYIEGGVEETFCKTCDIEMRKDHCSICDEDVIITREEDGEIAASGPMGQKIGPAVIMNLSCGHSLLNVDGHWCDASEEELATVREATKAIATLNTIMPKVFRTIKEVRSRHKCSKTEEPSYISGFSDQIIIGKKHEGH